MKINILPFSLKHKKDVLLISEKEVGKNFINHQYLNFFLNNKNAKGIVAQADGKTAGFSFFQWCEKNDLPKYIFTDKNWLLNIAKDVQLVGYRNLTAVKKEFQNSGIGKKLVETSIAELRKKTSAIANVAWVSGNKKNLGQTLRKFGLQPLKTIRNYWRTDSIEKKYECAVCGLPPCKCTAVIYFSV